MKKKKNWFLRMLTILFIIFIALFIVSESGYYEAKVSKSVALTNDAIKQFESDIINGNIVDINSYMTKEQKDYSNTLTNAADKIGSSVEEVLTNGFTNVWEIFKILFT